MNCKSALVCIGVMATLGAVTAHAVPLAYSTFVSSSDLSSVLGNTSTIGFAYAQNKFVGSVYFDNQLYQTSLTGGGVTLFGDPLPISSASAGEIYVSSSLGLGGFGLGDVFAGSQSFGTVYRYGNAGGAPTVFASGLVGGVRSIAFDPYGQYGNNMIVATNAGNIYAINSAGVATLLANTGEDTEGLNFAPEAFAGRPLGTLFTASEGSGSIRAITPTGGVSVVTTVSGGAEMLSFVPLNLGSSGNPVEGFYASAFPSNVVTAGASQFAGLLGDLVVTSEFSHAVTDITSGLVQSSLGFFPAQPEDGIFVTAALIRPPAVPEPETWSLLLLGLAMLGLGFRRARYVRGLKAI